MHTSHIHTNSCFFPPGIPQWCSSARISIPDGVYGVAWHLLQSVNPDSSQRSLSEGCVTGQAIWIHPALPPSSTNITYTPLRHVEGHPYSNISWKSVNKGKMSSWLAFPALWSFMLGSTFTFRLPPHTSVIAQVVSVQAETGNSNMIHAEPMHGMLFAVMLWRQELNEACLFNASLPQPQLKMLCGMFDFGGETRNIGCQTWAR